MTSHTWDTFKELFSVGFEGTASHDTKWRDRFTLNFDPNIGPYLKQGFCHFTVVQLFLATGKIKLQFRLSKVEIKGATRKIAAKGANTGSTVFDEEQFFHNVGWSDQQRFTLTPAFTEQYNGTTIAHVFNLTELDPTLIQTSDPSFKINAPSMTQRCASIVARRNLVNATVDDFTAYRNRVDALTEQTLRKVGAKALDKQSVLGTGAVHLDHIYSVRRGFDEQIPVEVIAHHSNLEYLPFSQNLSKQANCNKTKEDLYRDFAEHETMLKLVDLLQK